MEFEIEWIESDNYKTLQKDLTFAYENNRFIAVIGGSGWGKSFNFNIFSRTHDNVHIEEIESTMDTSMFFEHLINKYQKIDYATNKLWYTIQDASNIIKKIGTKSMFIIDEAGNFKPSMYRHIRDFRKHTKDHSSLVISGPRQPFYETIEKLSQTNKYGMKEFKTRVNKWVFLEEPSREELIGVLQVNGFNKEQIVHLIAGCDNFRDIENNIINYWIEHGITPKLQQDAS